MSINSLILNNLNYSIILFNEELKIESLNIYAQEMTDYSDAYTGKLTLNDFFYNNKYIIGKIEEVIKTGEGFIDFEFEFISKRHRKLVVILEIYKIIDNKKFYILVSMKDITRFKEMDDNIKNEERLEHFSTFIAEISHEIRNPLGGVKASASYIKKRLDEKINILPEGLKDLTQFIEIIVKEINRINVLIEDLLSLSKKHKINVGKININRVVNEIIELEKNNIEAKNVNFIKEFDPSLPEIYGSEDAMKQVFLNIIKNSVASIKNNGFIKVVTRCDASRNSPMFIRINFVDNGCGISKKDLKKIFDPFFTTKEKGSGLGLAICQKIIFEHNGFINLISVKNKGTDIAVYLPIEKIERKR